MNLIVPEMYNLTSEFEKYADDPNGTVKNFV